MIEKQQWLEKIKLMEPTFVPGSAVARLISELDEAWAEIKSLKEPLDMAWLRVSSESKNEIVLKAGVSK